MKLMAGPNGLIGATATFSVNSTEKDFARDKTAPSRKKQKKLVVTQPAHVRIRQ